MPDLGKRGNSAEESGEKKGDIRDGEALCAGFGIWGGGGIGDLPGVGGLLGNCGNGGLETRGFVVMKEGKTGRWERWDGIENEDWDVGVGLEVDAKITVGFWRRSSDILEIRYSSNLQISRARQRRPGPPFNPLTNLRHGDV